MNTLDKALNQLLDSKTILGDHFCATLMQNLNQLLDSKTRVCATNGLPSGGPSNDEIVQRFVKQLEDQSKNYNRWNSTSLGNLIMIYQYSHSTVLQDKAKEVLREYVEYLQSSHGHANVELYRTLFNSAAESAPFHFF